MSSFELKPLQRLAFGHSLELATFTQPRDRVPILLQDRGVGLGLWTNTFDAVYDQFRYLVGETSPVSWWMFCPCCLCCTLPYLLSLQSKFNQSWIKLAEQQNELYRPYGVQVSLAQQMHVWGHESTHTSNEIVGLRFDISSVHPGCGGAAAAGGGASSSYPYAISAATYAADPSSAAGAHGGAYPMATAEPLFQPLSPMTMSRPSAPPPPPPSAPPGSHGQGGELDSLTQQLERLANLHRTGALTDAEYQAAKSKILH